MREHKYKAYHKEFDILTDIELINIIMRGVGVNYGCGQKAWRFNEIELMQSTGLKDKNGVEIYEGYIVSVYWLAELGIEELDCNAIGVVEFDKEYSEYKIRLLKEYKRAVGGIGYYTETEIPLIHLNDREDDEQPYEYEVIGNIYQDKHLLEETNK